MMYRYAAGGLIFRVNYNLQPGTVKLSDVLYFNSQRKVKCKVSNEWATYLSK